MDYTEGVVVQTKVPFGLFEKMQMFIDTGLYRNIDELFFDALRRLVESHRLELMEYFVRQDVKWGLYGDE